MNWDTTVIKSVVAKHVVKDSTMAVPAVQWDLTIAWFIQVRVCGLSKRGLPSRCAVSLARRWSRACRQRGLVGCSCCQKQRGWASVCVCVCVFVCMLRPSLQEPTPCIHTYIHYCRLVLAPPTPLPCAHPSQSQLPQNYAGLYPASFLVRRFIHTPVASMLSLEGACVHACVQVCV